MVENIRNGHRITNRDLAAQQPYTPEYGPIARRPAEEREYAFHPLAWLADGASGLVEELRHNDLGLSQEFWRHFYAAQRETLLAARAFFSSLLDQSEEETRKAQEQAQRRERRGGVAIE
jgi:hypothetical protein